MTTSSADIPEGEPAKAEAPLTFPNIVPDSIRQSRVRYIDHEHIDDDAEFERLLTILHDEPEAKTYVFHPEGFSLNPRILGAVRLGVLVIEETQSKWYLHPSGDGSFVRLLREPPEFDWIREVKERGPMYFRNELRLSEKERRRRDNLEAAAVIAAATSPAPSASTLHQIVERHWQRHQGKYGLAGMGLALAGLLLAFLLA